MGDQVGERGDAGGVLAAGTVKLVSGAAEVDDLGVGRVQDQAAVAQHHHPVGDGADLGHLVRGVDHGDTVIAQPAHDGVEALDLSFGDGGGRLVEHHHPGAGTGGLDDLDDLAQADGRLPIRAVGEMATSKTARVSSASRSSPDGSGRPRCSSRPTKRFS